MVSRFLWLNFIGKGRESVGCPVIEGDLWSPLKENFTLIIFSLFHLNWPRIWFYNPNYKNEIFFSSKTHISTSFAQDIYGLYVLTWTNFNDVNGGRNILEYVYMIREVNSNRFEISNGFEMPFRLDGNLHGDFTVATFETIARLYCTCANDVF